MCGLAALLRPAGAPAPRRDDLDAMIAMLRHRGPDGRGVESRGSVGLAHARLAIIDIEGGAQPIANEDGSVRVVFNGEIFNHVELRAELERLGHRFRTRSDTEVLVHLYEEHGERFVDRLNGQFAIVLHDERRERVVLARDRVGIRPLYHALLGDGTLAVASEIKALFALPGVPRRLDAAALGEVFGLWCPLAPRTAFEGVRQLPSGHLAVVELRRERLEPRIERYWDWDFDPDAVQHRDEADCAEELHALLVDALRLQLRADVPVGSYLSGGLDSSAVTALAHRHSDAPLRSFSLTFEDAEFDESAHQRVLADHLRTQHSSIRVRREDIAAAFARTVWHAETPLVRTAAAPLMLLSGHVRDAGYKVVLSGEGADEVFAGYDLFKEAKVRRFVARQPGSPRRVRLLERLYPYLAHSPAAAGAFARRFFGEGAQDVDEPWFAHGPRIATTRRALQFLLPEVRERAMARHPAAALAELLPPAASRWAPLGCDQYLEARTLLSGYLLAAQGDRVAMANSVESRVPFLDHRVIEFANRLPPRYKLRGLREKLLLKRSMRAELPPAIVARSKQPYRAPDSACFIDAAGKPRGEVAELLGPQSIDAAGLFDRDAVARLLAKCAAGRAIGFGDNMAFVGVLSTMLLHAQFIRPSRFAAPAP